MKVRMFENEGEKKITSLPSITVGDNIIINDIPYVNTLTFEPVLIEWNGTIPNPLYNTKSKTVGHYYNKISPKRKSQSKLVNSVKLFFEKNPNLLTDKNLDLPLGEFIQKLKQSGNDDYKLLVHNYGDEEDYIKFKVKGLTKEKGLYIWVVDNVPTYIGIAAGPNGLYNRINNEYGSVTAYKCTVDGQTQTCRSNTKLRDEFNAKKNIALYVTPIDVEKYLNDPKFIKTMEKLDFKLTRKEKNVLEIFEKFIIEKGNFKDGGWNRRMEEGFIERMKKLAGIDLEK